MHCVHADFLSLSSEVCSMRHRPVSKRTSSQIVSEGQPLNKERLAAFADAILAIITTILVLAPDAPKEPTLEGFWDLRISYFSYVLFFFWLGSLWMGLNEVWDTAERIDNVCVMWTLMLLFFASLIPYTSDLVSRHFDNRIMQCAYGLVVLVMAVANWMLHRTLEKPNADVEVFLASSRRYRHLLGPGIAIKLVALVASAAIWPPGVMCGVLAAAAYFFFMRWKAIRTA